MRRLCILVAEAQAVESGCLFEKISYPNGYGIFFISFYSHVNFSVTKIVGNTALLFRVFYSHVNFSVTKTLQGSGCSRLSFTVT